LSYPAFALPGSRRRVAGRSVPTFPMSPGSHKPSESRCYPAASHVLENVTRQSGVPTVCHPAVGKPSNSGPDCGLSLPGVRRRRPGVRDLASMLPGVRRREEPGGAGPRRRPPALGPPRQPPRSCAHAAPLRPSAWSGARRWGESCELSLSKI